MTRLSDGKRVVEITMNEWTGTGYTPDWSNDFFNVGCLPYDEENDCYIVDDIEYCIDQAKDCINCDGDYSDGIINENSNLDINIL